MVFILLIGDMKSHDVGDIIYLQYTCSCTIVIFKYIWHGGRGTYFKVWDLHSNWKKSLLWNKCKTYIPIEKARYEINILLLLLKVKWKEFIIVQRLSYSVMLFISLVI
jgi:hypothetical protein